LKQVLCHPHPHWKKYQYYWTEQWTVITEFEGVVTQTAPVKVGGNRVCPVGSGIEQGWTAGWDRNLW
jgi:hypothetical protein